VDKLARARALIAHRLLESDPAEPAHAVALEHDRHCRERHRERFSDLGRRHAQLPQRDDHSDTIGRSAIGDTAWRRGTIEKALLTVDPVAADPLARAAHADPSGLGRRRHRPPLTKHPIT
jgi:hypothetical protein